jgi:hypothetical protein
MSFMATSGVSFLSALTAWSGCRRINQPSAARTQWPRGWPRRRQSGFGGSRSQNVQIHAGGGLAYKLAEFATWFEEAGQTGDEPVTGSHLWVLRKSLPAHWQVAVIAWSNSTAGG